MNNLDKQYTDLLKTILEHGVVKKDRTGTGTQSIFGYTIRHNMKDGFPLLTTKKMPFKTIVTELLWFLRGDTNIKFLVDNNCHIWDGDAYKNFKSKTYPQSSGLNEFDKEDFIIAIKNDDYSEYNLGELGPIYGKQWRDWETYNFSIDNDFGNNEFGGGWNVKQIDQIANLINDLKTNPDSRRLMVNAWNVGELDQTVLPPCHYGFQVYTRELSEYEKQELYFTKHPEKESDTKFISDEDFKEILKGPQRAISLMWNQRSCDVPLGIPFNIASYGLLLEIFGKMVNMVPEELIGNLGDTHIYLNQIDGVKEQLTRYPYKLPTLKFEKTDEYFKSLCDDMSLLSHLEISDFKIENYESHPGIKIPLSN